MTRFVLEITNSSEEQISSLFQPLNNIYYLDQLANELRDLTDAMSSESGSDVRDADPTQRMVELYVAKERAKRVYKEYLDAVMLDFDETPTFWGLQPETVGQPDQDDSLAAHLTNLRNELQRMSAVASFYPKRGQFY